MRSCIDLSKEPWCYGANYLAGLHDLPNDSWMSDSDTRRAARIILVENRIRRSRGLDPIDFMSVRKDRKYV